ncbi:hypothetical protein DMUE_1345 [Dictyocoela muelleri]|nr:hypothetical protein DMUE_1345 [Dictyocoela muelleri]
MYLAFIILNLFQILKASKYTLSLRDKNMKEKPLSIQCNDDININLDYEVWSKYEYFHARMRNLDLFQGGNGIIAEEFSSQIFSTIKDITLNKNTLPLKIDIFFETLLALDKFLIYEEFKSTIYNNLFKTGLDCNINEILDLYINFDQNLTYQFINIWHFLWYEVLKRFELSLEISDKTIEISNKANTNIFETDIKAIRNLNGLKFNLSIFNSDKVIADFDHFIEIIRILISGLLYKKSCENQIFKLFINGKCSSKQFERLNSIFFGNNFKITEIILEDLYIDHEAITNEKSPVETFIENFYSLQKIEITVPYFKNVNSFIKFLKNKIIRNKLYSLGIIEINNFTIEIGLAISKLVGIKKLFLLNCNNFNEFLSVIFDENNVQKNLLDLSIITQGVQYGRNSFGKISNFKNLQKLDLSGIWLSDSVLSNILRSDDLKKSLKELYLPLCHDISIQTAQFIANMEVLEVFKIEHNIIKEEIMMIILSSEKLKKTIKKLYIDPSIHFNETMVNHLFEFAFLEEFFIYLWDNNNFNIFMGFLNDRRIRKIIKKLNFVYLENNRHDLFINSIENFKTTEILEIGSEKQDSLNKISDALQIFALKPALKSLLLKNFRIEENFDFEIFSNFKNLERLTITFCSIDGFGLSKILKLENLQKTMKELELSFEIFTEEDAKQIGKFYNLEKIILTMSDSTPNALKILLNSKNLQKTIKSLHIIHNNKIEYTEIIYLLKEFEMLENLGFYDKEFDKIYLEEILKSEKLKSSLKKIYLCGWKMKFPKYQNFRKKCSENMVKLY